MIKKLLISFLTATIVISSLSGCKKNTSTNTDETSGIEVLDKETTEYEKETTGSTEDSDEEETMASEEGTEPNSEEETSEEETMASEETDKEETDTTVQTEAPTTAPTVAPTVKPTQAPTVAPTIAPTKPVVKPTQAPTAKPTVAPTQAPTAKPTEAPTELFVPVVKETAAIGAGNYPEVVVPLPKDEDGESWNMKLDIEVLTKNIPYGYVLTQKDLKVTVYAQNPETKEWGFIKELKNEEVGFNTYYINENWETVITNGVCNSPTGVLYLGINIDGLTGLLGNNSELIMIQHGTGNKEFDNYIKNNKPVYTNVKIRRSYFKSNIYKYGDWYFGFYTNKCGDDGLCIVGYAGPGGVAVTVPTEILGQKVICECTTLLEICDNNGKWVEFSLTDWDSIKKKDNGYPDYTVPEGIIEFY